VLLPGGCFDCGDDLPCDTQLCEGPEGSKLVGSKVAYGLVQPNHTFLDDVLAISSDEKIRPGFGSYEVAILADQVLLGYLIPTSSKGHYLFITQTLIYSVVASLRVDAQSHLLQQEAPGPSS
jgi:hypothetical protein